MNTGWAGKVMTFLHYATQLVALNFLWIFGALAGGIILGIAPATRSTGRLVTALSFGEPSTALWRDYWSSFRLHFWKTNKVGWPFTALAILVCVDLIAFRVAALNAITGTGLFLGPFVLVTLLALIANAYLHASLLRFSDSTRATIKFAFAAPIAFLPSTAAILLINIAFLMLTWQFPITVVLVGFSVPLGASIVVAGNAMDRVYGARFLVDDPLLQDANASWITRNGDKLERRKKK